MTQENDSDSRSGSVPDTAAAPAPKAAPAKKTASRKPAAKKTAPAKEDAPAAEAKKTPAKKPRATARAAAPKTKAAAPADTPEPGETAVKKTAPARKPKTAPKPAAKATPLPPPEPETGASAAAPVKEKPAPKQRASRGKPGQAAPAVEKAPEKPVEKAPEKSVEPVAEKPAEKPVEPERREPESHAAAQAPSQTAAPAGEEAGAPAKPASRRSRRGGRRRNKSRVAAAENAIGTEAPQAGNGHAEPQPEAKAEAKSEAKAAVPEQRAKQPSSSGGKKDAPKTASREKEAAKPAKGSKPEEQAKPAPEPKVSGGKRSMFISVLSGELVEVVLAEKGSVEEYYVEMQHQAKVKGNIYKGVVSNIDANLQAAFVSYAGGVKNGFLQIDEVHPEYYLAHHDVVKGRKYPPIQKVLRPGQEILVQVVKEPAGTKGAFLTSYLSLPGRFLVLTPGREQIGVSRKVDNDEERGRLRELLEGLKPGKGLGVIVRTVSTGASKTSLQRDLQFLKRLWKDVRTKGQTAPAPSLIYEELDLSTRAVRDYLTDDVHEVWVDDPTTATQLTELASLLFPKKKDLVRVHQEAGQGLFERFSLQKQLDQIHSREVSLPSGGSLVIDKTEALTAIDINSGRSGGKSNFEDMAYRTNLEAAKAIPLQLRLRDIGGQIVADFIEMRDREHWREVEKTVRAGMKGDRARYDVGKIGPFGMLEIVRQRLGSSAISISTEPCPCCKGTGIRRNMEWQAMQALRDISRQLRQAGANNQTALTFQADQELAFYLLNAKRALLQNMETETGVTLAVAPKPE